MQKPIHYLKWLLCCAALAVSSLGLAATSYPDRPIHLVVPYVAGGTSDILARILGGALGQALGQTVIIENKGGAGGNIGSEYVARAKNDGYTLLLGSVGPQAINVSLYRHMPYDPIKDFTPVALFATVPTVLVVGPRVPAHNVKQLIALARKEPGKLSFASAGVGTTQHLAGELLKQRTGINVLHVPYKGGGAALTDLISGRTTFMFPNIPLVYGQIKSGSLTPLAIASDKRSAALPNVPTMDEAAGLHGFEISTWFGILAPAGLPPAITGKLNRAIDRIVQTPQIRKQFERQGAEPLARSPEQFQHFMSAQIRKWADVVHKAGIRPQ